jgi:uncharacterized membrane protein
MHSLSNDAKPSGSKFRKFFLRGLGIVLPTILTIWILTFAYRFLSQNIAEPINQGLRWAVVQSGWPHPQPRDYLTAERSLTPRHEAEWSLLEEKFKAQFRDAWTPALRDDYRREFVAPYARRVALESMWASIRIGNWRVLDLLGLIIAIIGIYMLGALLGGFIGGSIVRRLEKLIHRMPLIRSVYPAVKQVTDFLVGEKGGVDAESFNRVVAVQYPRKGLWSVGLVTGNTMRAIEDGAGEPCLTVFIPSSPTPFTGYVITVTSADTIELPVSIEDAIKFTVSLGVVIPPSQTIARPEPVRNPARPALATSASPPTPVGE